MGRLHMVKCKFFFVISSTSYNNNAFFVPDLSVGKIIMPIIYKMLNGVCGTAIQLKQRQLI